MQWKTLFSGARLSDKASQSSSSSDRTDYERDFDRVVFSAAFRRLQDKTQVIPLPESDFVHTRLTHSLEVSCVARSLGKLVGETILQRHGLKDIVASDFGVICATAALAHDIGNPPFGHSGEASISNYFNRGNGKRYQSRVSAEQWADLASFEGNANGFKLLTNYNEAGGGNINLTFSTLAAFTKYPTRSLKDPAHKAIVEGKVSQKKYGYFQSEADIFKRIFTHLEIDPLTDYAWRRHPLAFLVEAADDICYRIIDFEDGIRIGLIDFSKGEELLKAVLGAEFNKERYDSITEEREKISWLRARAIYVLINHATQIFLDHEAEILSGTFDTSLIDKLPKEVAEPLNKILALSIDKVYRSRNVLQIELAGFNVVSELLELYTEAVEEFYRLGGDEKKLRKENPYFSKVLGLYPKQFLPGEENVYLQVLRVCEFVAGMTDTYAVSLYRKLKGIELPK